MGAYADVGGMSNMINTLVAMTHTLTHTAQPRTSP